MASRVTPEPFVTRAAQGGPRRRLTLMRGQSLPRRAGREAQQEAIHGVLRSDVFASGPGCGAGPPDVPRPKARHPIPPHYDETIFTPHTTTNVSIVKDANSNALSTEANFITPPS